MPTFRSLGIHPDLRDRLATETLAGDTQPVETPQALLSRNPDSLRVLEPVEGRPPKALSHKQSARLRSEVAAALLHTHDQILNFIRKRINHQYEACTDDGSQSGAIPGCLSALELMQFEEASSKQRQIEDAVSTGIPALDKLIIHSDEHDDHDDGVHFCGHVSQICGPPAAGKTQLALQMALICAKRGQHVWYLCSHHHSLVAVTRRMAEMLRRQLAQDTSQPDQTGTILHRIVVQPVKGYHELLRNLSDMEEKILLLDGEDAPRLLVVDSISSIMSADNRTDWLTQVQLTFKRLARTYHLAILLVNGTTNSDDSLIHRRGRKPALGKKWSREAADIQLWLQPQQQNQSSVGVFLERHPNKDCDLSKIVASTCIEISAQGILGADSNCDLGIH